MFKVSLFLVIVKDTLPSPTHSTWIKHGNKQNLVFNFFCKFQTLVLCMCFLSWHFKSFLQGLLFQWRWLWWRQRNTKETWGHHSPHKESVRGLYKLYLMAPNCIEPWLGEKCCFHLSFNSFTRLILLPKLLLCFMFLQSANGGHFRSQIHMVLFFARALCFNKCS